MKFKGVKLSETPNFEEADGKDDIFVGRIRKSRVFDRGFSYFAVGDNTRKGASLNAVEIVELLGSARERAATKGVKNFLKKTIKIFDNTCLF